MSKQLLTERYNCTVPQLLYNSLISAIPKKWKISIKTVSEPLDPKTYDVQHLSVDLKKLNNKIIYESLTFHKGRPSAENKWIEYYPFLETISWKPIYNRTGIITKDIRLQSFQYSILHRFFPCNQNLFIWKKSESPLCLNCNENDTIEHFFHGCQMLNNIWKDIKSLLSRSFSIDLNCTILEVLLGVPCTKYTSLVIANYVLLYTKFYIYSCKKYLRDINFSHYKALLRSRINAEIYILRVNGGVHCANMINLWERLQNNC